MLEIENNKNSSKKGVKNIVLMGLVSLFMDLSTEMVYPILPLFLVALGSTPFVIGIIEGIAEGLAALLKAISGYVSDKFNAKKAFVVTGYSASVIYKIGLLLSTSWVGVLISRIIDKSGKGIRTAPRDAIVADNGGKNLGKGFGLHKMLDMLGSALGVLLAYFILFMDSDYKTIILVSIVPACISVFILCFVKNSRKEKSVQTTNPRIRDLKLNKSIILYLVIILLFSIGNSSNAFLLLRAQDSGFTSQNVLLLYLLFSAVSSICSIPFGRISDKIGRKFPILISYLLYGAVYFGFAFATKSATFIVLFALYGVYNALIAGAEKAMLVELTPKEYKGTILGLSGTMQGVGLILSSFTAGLLWEKCSPMYAFIFGAILSMVSAVLVLFVKTKKTVTTLDTTNLQNKINN